MANEIKSNITFMPVVESISRKFALRRDTCATKVIGHKQIGPVQYMGSGARRQNIAGYGIVRNNYFFMRKFVRSTPVTSEEQLIRSYFASVSKWNKLVWKSLSVLTQNQEKWEEACADFSKTIKGVSAKGYDYRGWSFAIGMKIKQADETLPANGALPAFDA